MVRENTTQIHTAIFDMITNYIIPRFGQAAQMRIENRTIYTIHSTYDFAVRMVYVEKCEYID